MRTVIFFIILISKLLIWDVKFRFLRILSSRRIVDHLNKKVSGYAYALLKYARIYTGIKVEASKNLRNKLPDMFLLVSNHQSLADIVLLMSEFRRHSVRFVAKKSLGKWFPAVSQTLRMQRHALINRKSDFYDALNKIKILAKQAKPGICPVLFPEGTRSRSGELGEFYTGAFKQILRTKPMPVVCVALDGVYKIAALNNIFSNLQDIVYKMEIVSIYDSPAGRKDIPRIINDCRKDIEKKLIQWRSGE
ncbi:MAG: lysophospholipid acyltransferase family protein [Spirochaetia bacterium]